MIVSVDPGVTQIRSGTTLSRLHRVGPHRKAKHKKNPLGPNIPFLKGVVLKTVIKKPKKPNSANRKCVVVRLSNGKEMTAYVPGKIHNWLLGKLDDIYARRIIEYTKATDCHFLTRVRKRVH